MANQIEYSRLLVKRTDIPGIEPTIPTGDTIDNSWLDTDLAIGELFANINDDKIWMRTNNGLALISTGTTSSSIFTGGTIGGFTTFLSGATGDFTGTFYGDGSNLSGITMPVVYNAFTSGSTGSFSIKAVNDGSIDATGNYSYAEGLDTIASGNNSHAQNFNTNAIGPNSHAEGSASVASGATSHAEGNKTTANGNYSHSQGTVTFANGYASHSSGRNTAANGYTSFVHGNLSEANGVSTIVLGDGIIGNDSNTTYVENLKLLPGKTIMSMSGNSQIDLNYGLSDNELAITTDAGAYGETFLYMSPTVSSNGILAGSTSIDLIQTNFFSIPKEYVNIYNPAGKFSIGEDGISNIQISNNSTASRNTNIAGSTAYNSLFLNSQSSKFLSGVTNSVCIGGNNLTASTSNTVYISKLNINSIPTGTTTYNLAYDANGNIVRGSSTTYPKLTNVLATDNTTSGYNILMTDGDVVRNQTLEGKYTDLILKSSGATLNQHQGTSYNDFSVEVNKGIRHKQKISTGVGVSYHEVNTRTVTTTDATETIVFQPLSYLDIASTAVILKVYITALKSDITKAYTAELKCGIKVDSGTYTIINSLVDSDEKTEFTTATSKIDIESSAVNIKVIGENSTTINWSVRSEIIYQNI